MSAAGREALVALARRMNVTGLNQGTSGNLSERVEGGFLLTPSGLDYDTLAPEDIVFMREDGTWEGRREPSSEWRIHRDVYATRPEVGGVFHAHSMFSTSLACLRRPIPGFHYMVTRAGGVDIRCADYATFGSEELSRHVLRALEGRRACLMANHGMLAVGESLSSAFKLAVEVETLAAMYWRALQVGEPVLLDEAELFRVLEKWKTYGQTEKPPKHEE
ncbi:class II aldolase/adducin family protein [Archangium primigenium]|uniref:class II aldolase/adducin family protein n=1 Tax=[Archangium] primigenium TaxID=2792470 RepID=UPI0019596C7C|nr:class II aldolase/adducin family protein [Archangium primigenium]